MATYLARGKLDKVMSQPDFGWFSKTIDGGTAWEYSQIHAGGQ
jgi:tyrosinase